MGNPFDPMNILLVVFAVVAFIRLRSTLGKRTGNEEPLGYEGNACRLNRAIEKQSLFLQTKPTKLPTHEVLSQNI